MNGSVADHFSEVAAQYAAHRPRYPRELFAWLASVAPARRLAWDCATGNGQAAVPLAEDFQQVVATDASAQQIAQAAPHPRVTYRLAAAGASGLPDGSADLVTVAQALHWLPLEALYAEARRVAAPGGVLAAWCYGLLALDHPALDESLQRFHAEVAPFWPPGREHLEAGYRTLPFPFEEIQAPGFTMTADWRRDEFVAYLRTWSSVARFRTVCGRDPVEPLDRELEAAWGDAGSVRRLRWPLALRAGRVAPSRTAGSSAGRGGTT